jgi:tetratricopeptide (TPR) repeat protein
LLRDADVAGAAEQYQELMRLEAIASPFERAMISWAGAYLKQDLPGRVRHLQIALEYSPGNNILLVNLASARYQLGDYEEALEAIQSGIEMKWRYGPMYTLAALCNAHLGRFREMRDALETAVSFPSVEPDVYGLLQMLTLLTGDETVAEHYRALYESRLKEVAFRQGARSAGYDFEDVYRILGKEARERGYLAGAVECFRRAVAGEPKSAEFRFQLGRALFEGGELEAAIEELERCLSLEPGHLAARLTLGGVREQTGEVRQAIEHYQSYLTLAPSGEESEEVRKRLEALRASGSVR